MTRDEWISVAAALAIGIGVIEWSFIAIESSGLTGTGFKPSV
jgi:hypothetical protein